MNPADQRYQLVVSLPLADAGCGFVRFEFDGLDLKVEVTNGIVPVGHIVFECVTAFRFSDELHSGVIALESWDSLLEVVNSDWIRELMTSETPGGLKSVANDKHYVVFVSNYGYLEVVARRAEFQS